MKNPMLDVAQVRMALRQLDVKPSRAMGQNFLVDANALAAIVDAGEIAPQSLVVEVGPGLGVLTWELVQQAGEVISIELDKRLIARLYDEFAQFANLTLVNHDILKSDIAQITARRPYRVIANLPYAITSPVLRHFLESDHPPELMVVLVQREVAQRICAAPGDMSVLAHAMQIRAVPELVAIVPPEAFMPAPAVHSAVLRLRHRAVPLVPPADERKVMRVIKAGFLHARKQLGNSLSGGLAAHNIRIERDVAQRILIAAGIDPMRRAEMLTIDEWQRVATGVAAVVDLA
jgi:16S rRNA (adenine1518-N6/adenine1519-N6)-dimethyltransferase